MRRRGTMFQGGLLAAVLAATLHFVLWTAAAATPAAMPGGGAHAAFAGAMHHCADPAPHPGTAPDTMPAHHCALCPLCVSLSLPAALPAPPPMPAAPAPCAAAAARIAYDATAPPGRRPTAAPPRGPPALS